MICTNGKKVLNLSACEAVYTSCEYLLRYLTGMNPENGCAIVDKNGTTLYTDMRYMEAAEKLLKGTDVTPVLYKQSELLERLKGYQSVGVSFDQISHVEYLTLADRPCITVRKSDAVFEFPRGKLPNRNHARQQGQQLHHPPHRITHFIGVKIATQAQAEHRQLAPVE